MADCRVFGYALAFRITAIVGVSAVIAFGMGGTGQFSLAQSTDGVAVAIAPSSDKYVFSPIELINTHIRQAWEENSLKPSKPATDGEWCRRVHLDLIGRIPTVDELEQFTRASHRDKKQLLVDRLLGNSYDDAFARNWTTIWTNILIGRTGGTERRTLTSRPGMRQYLRESIQANKPYDTMVYELITARGSTQPEAEDFNGACNFLAGKLGENGIQATAKTSQIFLGMQVQCTQCHNHPFNEFKQNQFWEMNAFFRQTRALRSFDGREITNVRVDDQDFAGDTNQPDEAELFYELRNGILRAAYPVFVDGTALVDLYEDRGEKFGNSGYLSDINRRTELAKLVVGSSFLELAVVNRIWAHFLGYGFSKPIDDMGPHNPPTHPELLTSLANEVRSSSFDLKALMRWIVLSEPYSLSSRMNKDHRTRDNPAIGTQALFGHFYLRPMQAEELYESLLIATDAAKTLDSKNREAAKQRWLGQFSTAFGTDEGDEATSFNGSIPQALMMMNGELVARACGTDRGSFLFRIATDDSLKNKDKIRHLYLAALSRRPNGDEIAAANRLVILRKGNVAEALQDFWWALLNSNEFILNH